MSDDKEDQGVDPSSLGGDILEGTLDKTANDVWVLRNRHGETRIESILREYMDEEVRLTIASFSDLRDMAEMLRKQEQGGE